MSESNWRGAGREALGVAARPARRRARAAGRPAAGRRRGSRGSSSRRAIATLVAVDVQAGAHVVQGRGERDVAPRDAAGAQLAERRQVRALVEAADERLVEAVARGRSASSGVGRAEPDDAQLGAAQVVARDVERRARAVGQAQPLAAQVARRGCGREQRRQAGQSGHGAGTGSARASWRRVNGLVNGVVRRESAARLTRPSIGPFGRLRPGARRAPARRNSRPLTRLPQISHRAPLARAVARAVVEDPAAVRARAGLHPRSRCRRPSPRRRRRGPAPARRRGRRRRARGAGAGPPSNAQAQRRARPRRRGRRGGGAGGAGGVVVVARAPARAAPRAARCARSRSRLAGRAAAEPARRQPRARTPAASPHASAPSPSRSQNVLANACTRPRRPGAGARPAGWRPGSKRIHGVRLRTTSQRCLRWLAPWPTTRRRSPSPPCAPARTAAARAGRGTSAARTASARTTPPPAPRGAGAGPSARRRRRRSSSSAASSPCSRSATATAARRARRPSQARRVARAARRARAHPGSPPRRRAAAEAAGRRHRRPAARARRRRSSSPSRTASPPTRGRARAAGELDGPIRATDCGPILKSKQAIPDDRVLTKRDRPLRLRGDQEPRHRRRQARRSPSWATRSSPP